MSKLYALVMSARTTIRMDERLLKDAKRFALEHDKTFTALVEETLRDKIYPKAKLAREPVVLPTHDGGGTRPGVDLTNRHQLEDIMDGLIDPA